MLNPTSKILTTLIGFPIACWILISLAWAPTQIVITTPYPVTSNPKSVGLYFEDITIESDIISLEGWWIPANTPIAEMIFVHGAGSNRTSEYIGSLGFYKTLNEIGVSVITMDLRNHGNSPKTDGILRMGAGEWPDVIAAAKWLDQNQTGSLPRFVLGASMGGSAVIHAIHEGMDLDGLILLDPQLDIVDSLMKGGEIVTGLPSFLFTVAVRTAVWRYGLPTGRRNPLLLGSKLQLPILLIQDWEDPVTRSQFAQRLANINPWVDLTRVPPIQPNDICIEGKERWGSHVAAHSCHPIWTRDTIKNFTLSVIAASK